VSKAPTGHTQGRCERLGIKRRGRGCARRARSLWMEMRRRTVCCPAQVAERDHGTPKHNLTRRDYLLEPGSSRSSSLEYIQTFEARSDPLSFGSCFGHVRPVWTLAHPSRSRICHYIRGSRTRSQDAKTTLNNPSERLLDWFGSMRRFMAARIAMVGIMAVMILGGVIRIYSYTSPLSENGNVSASSTSQSAVPPCGNQTSSLQPQGCWADYIGYIPAGYLVFHLPNSQLYPCLPGMTAAFCKQFQASCGNGVCDPNESCSTCPIDCGSASGQTCSPYTGRVGSPAWVCQITLNATGQG
jgi:hypothetical protein